MEPKAQAAERLLRGLGVAVKTFALYPLPHPVTTKSIETLLASLRVYMEAHGPFAARVAKYSLSIDGIPFKGGAHANLAFYFFTRKVSYFKIMPAVSEQALSAFVAAVGTDRQSLETQGGVRHLLRQAGVGNIQVAEFALEDDIEEIEPLDLSGIFELLGRGRQAPQERERVIEILREGPEQARVLLENIYAIAGGGPEAVLEEEQVQQVYQAVRSLDRLMLDEPFEDRPQLYANLAGATLLMRAPVRSVLLRLLIERERGGATARMIGDHLSDEQVAQVVQEMVSGGNIAQQVTTFLRALCTDRQKAKAALSILDARLRPADASPTWLTDAVWPGFGPRPARREIELPHEFQFGGLGVPASGQDAELRLREARAIDDVTIGREVIRTLVDMLRAHPNAHGREVADVADGLMASMAWLVEHREFGLLRQVLTNLGEAATSESGTRRAMAESVLKRTAGGPLLDGLLAAMWGGRETTVEQDVLACLRPMKAWLVPSLIRALGVESRGGARAMLCDLLLDLDGDRIDDLGPYVSDSRWYLVRNVVSVLGRTRDARAVAHLGQLVGHPDYRVRRETVNALSAIGTEEAQGVIASFLDDQDERIRLRALQSMDSWEAWRAMPKILAVLQRPDPFLKQFDLKQAALEALARLGAKQSLPAVRKIAGSWFLFGARARELRRLAELTAAIIEGQEPLPERGFGTLAGRERHGP